MGAGQSECRTPEPGRERSASPITCQARPAYLKVWNQWGMVPDELGRREKVGAAFQKNLKLWPCYADARYNLGVARQ